MNIISTLQKLLQDGTESSRTDETSRSPETVVCSLIIYSGNALFCLMTSINRSSHHFYSHYLQSGLKHGKTGSTISVFTDMKIIFSVCNTAGVI